ncbi:hypothetical protein BZM27_42835 [Paraburkholderia steynii]|uniref:Transmembrane protein n=1 Tax=Paraburkholderia steynii TaxID=1245441 RepID=A0A4R0X274_9BURK|nr:hypothetical protein BZM27_42835 [Paraburkholderia steynii]
MAGTDVPSGRTEEDKRLARLYDYTKFHIGIYLSAAGALATLIVAIANGSVTSTIFLSLADSPTALVIGLVCMTCAAVCGGCVATSAIECRTYEELMEERQGVLGSRLWRGKYWVWLEHFFFWASVLCLGYVVFTSCPVERLLHWTAKACPTTCM